MQQYGSALRSKYNSARRESTPPKLQLQYFGNYRKNHKTYQYGI
jgi:hypothetical protein